MLCQYRHETNTAGCQFGLSARRWNHHLCQRQPSGNSSPWRYPRSLRLDERLRISRAAQQIRGPSPARVSSSHHTRPGAAELCLYQRGREQLIKARDVASRCSPRCWEAAALTPLAIPSESLAGRSSDRPDTSERDCQVSTLSNKNCS